MDGASGPIGEARTGLRAQVTARRVAVELVLALASAAVLATMNPFGVHPHASWAERLFYWLRTAMAAYLLYRPLLLGGALAARRLGFPEPTGWAAAIVMGSGVLALWLWWFGPQVRLDRGWPGAEAYVATYLQVLLTSALFALALWVTARPSQAAPAAGPSDEAAPREPQVGPRLAERLPARLGREILALKMEDHYVRVFTDRGDGLVLMRMGDAVADLAGFDGLQVHRSWWVARRAVNATRRRGRTLDLHLQGGLVAPVARDRMAALRAAGWI